MKRFLKDYLYWLSITLVPLVIVFGLVYLLGIKTDNGDVKGIAVGCFLITGIFTVILPFIDGTLKNIENE